MAPTIAVAVDELVAREQLVVTAGRIERCRLRDGGVDVDVRHRESTSSARVARVVNCTGYDPDPGRTTNPVVRHLICVGLARPDELSMGLDATPDGALVGAGGRPSPVLYALGPLLRGSRFETTAVPEIRDQARRLADVLTRSEVGAVAV
jgi:uncharacterized NAD(P)/FAD-binding protein YdhS